VDARLVEAGAEVRAHDPAARNTTRAALGPIADKVIFVDHPYDATVGADALVLVTEWQEYRSPDLERLSNQMRRKLLLDGLGLCQWRRERNQVAAARRRLHAFRFVSFLPWRISMLRAQLA
jgi:UDPglucose 6-dehydrogenase